ncbi:MAG: hypothetical protein KKA55_07115 [Proteobacteria bacterium]|nr:hypothetical protein [Pseudomonadota bacterium]MBU1595289.1 hypothetical protein [Pseudomonadota bacterium]
MAMNKADNIEALKLRRKELGARIQDFEKKIKHLTKEIAEEKAKPAFKSSKDPRHAKFQDAARRSVDKLQKKLDELTELRAKALAELNKCSLVIKGQA